ncbi:MFS transporter [Planomonospora venezuelensis]|uniref:MFS family permease n=1 Tax=Planomonospora venezuelensis TaxID=1999 RepID=A0A841CVF0_PLAVE|nr:MFS transporter [Planomonospora venezuelensis]MBB5962372.1 MFS family permease [Planomonospora venezuelensis]GIN00753.1 hypothetical protein Pve01_24110 [Planomonospora venezuelensis]
MTAGPGHDRGGVVPVTSGAFGVVWGLVRGNAAGWGSAEVLGALVLGVALVIAFVLWERRAKAPMLPMRFFRLRAFATANPANFCVFASLYGTLFFLAQYFQTVHGEGPLGGGLRLMPWTATLMVCAPIAGALADRYGERAFTAGGLLLQTAGMGWIAVVSGTGTDYLEILPALVIGGAGLTMAMPAAQKAVVGAVRPQEVGQASGAFMMLRIFGGVFGVAVAVFAGVGGYASAEEFGAGFSAAMGAAGTGGAAATQTAKPALCAPSAPLCGPLLRPLYAAPTSALHPSERLVPRGRPAPSQGGHA